MNKSRIFWGVFLILGAIFGLAAQMGLVEGVGLWAIFGTILFAALFVKSVFSRSFFGMFFSLAIIAIIYDKPLGIEAITPWPILGAAFCLALGCSWIFPKKKHNWTISKYEKEYADRNGLNITIDGDIKDVDINGVDPKEGYSEEETVQKDGGEWVNITQVFKSTSKYINSNNFSGLNAECVFCKVDIFFDGASMQGTCATVNLDNVFSNTTLYVPSTWTVKENNENVFANYSESGKKAPDGVHILILNCDNVFGGVKVIYV